MSEEQMKAASAKENQMIKHLVARFLSWKLPEDFSPDAGISFKPMFNEHTAHPMKHEPTGTNLFSATQAEAMVRHMLDGASDAQQKAAREMLGALYKAASELDPLARPAPHTGNHSPAYTAIRAAIAAAEKAGIKTEAP